MNMLINTITSATMSSREIAELTGKRHDHVMRDIRAMLAELHGENGVPNFGGTQINHQNGQSYPIFNLPKRETLILVSGYNVGMRAKIIDRWQELEAQPTKKPVIRNQNLAMIIQMATEMDAIQTAQQQQAIELAAVQKEIKTIGARSQPDTEFFTVLGYANLAGKKIDYKAAAQLGKKCKAMSDQCGYMTGTVPDARHGSVGTYHVSVLESVFDEFFAQKQDGNQ